MLDLEGISVQSVTIAVKGIKYRKRERAFKIVDYLHVCDTVNNRPESCFVVSCPEALLPC